MIRILHTNDFHGRLDDAREAKLSELRQGADLYFDSGDAIRAGNLAIPLRREEVWRRLDRLRCSASVLGNRESHVLQGPFAKKIEGAAHPLLCANLRFKDGRHPLPGSMIFQVGGSTVGVIGVMVPMVTSKMATQAASAYLWDPPIETAARMAEEMRPNVDCLIALTHIGVRQDEALARRCDRFDLILGGHSHTVLTEPIVLGRTAICQAGSHGRFAGRCDWEQGGVARYELVPLS